MKWDKICDKIIEYGFYLLFFATPLIFNPSRSFPSFELFEWNKMVFVYFLTVIITAAWIGKMIISKKLLIVKTYLYIPLLLFVFSQSMSTLFSIDRHVSIFGYYSRFHGGLISTICYVLLFSVFVSSFKKKILPNLLKFVLSSGLIVAIYGILERFGIDANMWVQDVRARVFSTLGQPNWLAAYLAILTPLTINIFTLKFTNASINYNQNQSNNEKLKNNLFNIGYLLIAILFYICLLLTKSRSGFLGFWIANLIFWAFILWSSQFFSNIKSKLVENSENINSWHKKSVFAVKQSFGQLKFQALIFFNLALIVINFFITTPFPEYNRLFSINIFSKNQVEETATPTNDTVINVGITDSSNIRKIVWGGAIDIAKNFPLFGTGPETFAYAYYKYRPQEHNLTSEWDFLYNKAHNEYLNFAATSGFFGLGVYLLLIFWVLIYAVKSIITSQQKHIKYWIGAILAGYISILITNFFGFSVVIVGLYFFLIPAFIYVINISNSNDNSKVYLMLETQNPEHKLLLWQKILLGINIVASIYLIFSISLYWLADTFYARANSFSQQEDFQTAYQNINFALDLNDGEPNYHDEKANIASSLALAAIQNKDSTQSANLVLEAVSESTKALKISPQNINFWKTRTRILFNLSEINPAFTESALDAIKITSQLAPTDAKITYNMAVIAGRLNKPNEAIDALVKTIELKPDYRDAYIALSIFYTEVNKKDKAREILELILKRIDPNDAEVKSRLEKL